MYTQQQTKVCQVTKGNSKKKQKKYKRKPQTNNKSKPWKGNKLRKDKKKKKNWEYLTKQ